MSPVSARTSSPVVTTRPAVIAGPLVDRLPADEPVTHWVRRGDGLVGIGEVARFEGDPVEADAWWRDLVSGVHHDTHCLAAPGVGPVAFGSFAFDPGRTRQHSVLVVPRVVVGRRGRTSWVTSWDGEPALPVPADPAVAPSRVVFGGGTATEADWTARVASAVFRIRAGDLDKVVLARDITAELGGPLDVRWLLGRLVERFASTWSFHVDGLVGATPELLVRREQGLVTSRVLAGTIRRQGTGVDEHILAETLMGSSKDLAEHEYAVASVADVLTRYCSGMNVPDSPYVLQLPNVLHLASDVTGVARSDASSLAIAAALHPSAAVCGTPTDAARTLIRSLEGMDRGRYAGPVGWMDQTGDGEWGIALRCAAVEPSRLRLYAGCGIVADSDPDAELAETEAKLVAMRSALTGA